ncbi:Signal transduction histidine kinase [Mucilaginibacter pineti]|uniref:histidine kinase n=1 Tax=Mucilaginibacter pineti TaxID=1391627 RepID=A0A1G6U406_9SPHI|nr:HAMP domain-containing sensor histidine kinase [Mucilaginibacter pineti]SDD35416.1 Signal transduction histidine kinase [Mucilaginibacter pineti]
MKIKNRLALYYTLLSSGTLLLIMMVMYLLFMGIFRADFYNRLNDRAKLAAQLYLEADEISMDSLDHVRERMIERLPDEVIRIYNAHNMASFIKDRQQYWGSTIIEQVRKEKYASFSEGSRQTIGIYYPDNQGNFVILASAYDMQGHSRLKMILETLVIIFMAVIGGFFFIGRWFAKRSLSPIDQLISQIRRITASNLHLRLDKGNNADEIGILAGSFNQLLEHLQNSFELQQTFIASASHELRTPVTSIIGEIEVSLQKDRDTDSYRTSMLSLLADAERLTTTISSLMELAQTDMSYTQGRREPLRIDELIWELQEHWEGVSLSGVLTVQISSLPDDQQRLVIPADRTLMTLALNNIIANAFKFSGNGPVILKLAADTQSLVINIIDQGIGIPLADIDKIFKPFFRSQKGRVYQGSGVGLYIANKIIQLYHGKIQVESKEGQGTTFTIVFGPIF